MEKGTDLQYFCFIDAFLCSSSVLVFFLSTLFSTLLLNGNEVPLPLLLSAYNPVQQSGNADRKHLP
jgi:hypothetical protein